MAKPKAERNRLFLEDWQKGLNNQSLAEKYNLSIGGVKALKQRLRVKQTGQKSTKIEKEVAQASGGLIKFASKPATQETSKVVKYKKVTYYLNPKMTKDIKRLALERDKDISELVRQIFAEYLSKESM